MLHRIVRPVLLTLCILTGIAAGAFLGFSQYQTSIQRVTTSDTEARVERAIVGLSELGTALQAYLAPGQTIAMWAPRAETLRAQLAEDAAALAAMPDGGPAREALQPAIAALETIDRRVRDYLRSGDDLMAADLAFNEARNAIATAVSLLRDWRAAQRSGGDAGARTVHTQQATALGILAGAWALSLVLVRRRTPAVEAAAVAEMSGPDVESLTLDGPIASFAPMTAPPVDLARMAAACGDMARAGDSEALRAALGRGADALGARGLVVWLGVEDALFAVASHGYDERHLKRPIPRDATNVTAEAWRTAESTAIPGEADAPGVLVVPMVGAAGCRGVVSAELHPGIPADTDRQFLLAVFAAQLAGLVGATAPAAAVATDSPAAAETGAPASPAVEQAS